MVIAIYFFRGNQLSPHRLLFPKSSKGSFICTFPQTGAPPIQLLPGRRMMMMMMTAMITVSVTMILMMRTTTKLGTVAK